MVERFAVNEDVVGSSPTRRAYIAAWLDKSGRVGVSEWKDGTRTKRVAEVVFYDTNLELLTDLKEELGGFVVKSKKELKLVIRKKDSVYTILRWIIPCLIDKQQKAKETLAAIY